MHICNDDVSSSAGNQSEALLVKSTLEDQLKQSAAGAQSSQFRSLVCSTLHQQRFDLRNLEKFFAPFQFNTNKQLADLARSFNDYNEQRHKETELFNHEVKLLRDQLKVKRHKFKALQAKIAASKNMSVCAVMFRHGKPGVFSDSDCLKCRAKATVNKSLQEDVIAKKRAINRTLKANSQMKDTIERLEKQIERLRARLHKVRKEKSPSLQFSWYLYPPCLQDEAFRTAIHSGETEHCSSGAHAGLAPADFESNVPFFV